MSNIIHPTAIIDSKAKLGINNYVGPYCIIGPNVTIGDNNRFEAYVSIGTQAEHRDYFHIEAGPVNLGSHNIIREFVTINGGTTSITKVEDNIIMLRGSHIGHDCQIGRKSTLSCNVLVGGHSIICEGANLGLSSVVHQHRVIGSYSLVGMNSSVTKNIIPFVIAFGSPCNPQKINRVGLIRNGVVDNEITPFEKWFFSMNGLFDKIPKVEHSFNKYLEDYEAKKSYLYKILGL